MERNIVFQHAKVENRGSLAHNDDQKQEEVEKDIKKPSEVIEEADKKTIEYFMSHVEELEKQEEDLVTGSSNETIGSCDFEIDNFTVFAVLQKEIHLLEFS